MRQSGSVDRHGFPLSEIVNESEAALCSAGRLGSSSSAKQPVNHLLEAPKAAADTHPRGTRNVVIDRIAEPWGRRTPHGRGTVWPARVDTHLDAGLSPEDVDRWVQSACVLCSNGCGCDIAVKDGRMVGVRGRATDVVSHGRLGPKGLYGSTPWASSADRLTRPLIREDGVLVPTDWATASIRVSFLPVPSRSYSVSAEG